MRHGIFIAGTDTEVGKTYITCRLLEQFRARGVDAVGMKPVASGMTLSGDVMINEDVELILQASARAVDRELVNQYSFEPFIAPHLAAWQLGCRIDLKRIRKAFDELRQSAELVVVEGAGGLMTPLNADQTYLDLVQQLKLDVVLVVAIRLGCINHALLTQEALMQRDIRFSGWVANYVNTEQDRDRAVERSLAERLNAPLLGVMPRGGPASRLEIVNLVN